MGGAELILASRAAQRVKIRARAAAPGGVLMDEPRRLCPNEGCDQVNPAAAKFCARCGRPLPALDPRSLSGAPVGPPAPQPTDAAEVAEFAWRLGGFAIILSALLIGSLVLFRLQGLTNGIWLVLPLIGFGAWINPWRRRT